LDLELSSYEKAKKQR